ncbi:hypothetical protein YC2023_050228 [Brassica napus]
MRNQGKSPSFSLLLHKGLNWMGKLQWFGFELRRELWSCGSFSSGDLEREIDESVYERIRNLGTEIKRLRD